MSDMTDLNFDNLTADEKVFKEALESSGIPITEEGIKSEFQKIVDDSEFIITNTSAFSPFWVLIKDLLTKPIYFFTLFLVKYVMPNSFVKTAKGNFLDLIAWAFDIKRKPSVKAIGNLTFRRNITTQPLIIPKQTSVRTVKIKDKIYRMLTVEDGVFQIGESILKITAQTEKTGAAYNLGAGYYSILESEIPTIISVTNKTDYLTSPGADIESDNELRLRIRNQFTAVSSWHTDSKYKSIITSQIPFRVDRLFFMHNNPRGPGSADCFLLFDTYTPSQIYLDKLNDYINTQGNHGHGDNLLVKAIPYIDFKLSLTVYFEDLLDDDKKAELLKNLEQFIRCAFRENSDYAQYLTQTYPYSRFSFAKFDQELFNYFTSGFKSFVWHQNDIISDLNVPGISTLTITEGV